MGADRGSATRFWGGIRTHQTAFLMRDGARDMMTPETRVVKDFFDRWEHTINTLDFDLMAPQYADPFMFGDHKRRAAC